MVLLVAQVVNRLRLAEEAVRIREADAQRLLELSELLTEGRPLQDLLQIVTSIVQEAFACESTALLLPGPSGLEIVASSGRDLSTAELRRIQPEPGVASSLTPPTARAPASSRNLLDMSRIETGSLVVNRQPVDFEAVIAEAVNAVGPHLAGGRVSVLVPAGLPQIEADHVLVEQVLVNLIENALRYAPPGTAVDVTARDSRCGRGGRVRCRSRLPRK